MNRLIIISGFSGAGKGTMIKELLGTRTDIWLSKSDTDRSKRNETDYYNYVSTQQMRKNLHNGIYLEYNKYGNHYYATPKKPILEKIKEGYDVLLEIDVNGMRMVCQDQDLKKLGVNVLTAFIVCDAYSLEKRLIDRGDSSEEIRKRLTLSVCESQFIREYDYTLINDGDLVESVKKLERIIQFQLYEENIFDDLKFRKEAERILKKYN